MFPLFQRVYKHGAEAVYQDWMLGDYTGSARSREAASDEAGIESRAVAIVVS